MAGGVVVEFFVDGGPILHPFGDRRFGVDESDGDGELGAVAGGLEAGEFEPGGDVGEGGGAVAVHGAVEENSGFAGLVGFEDALDEVQILHVGGAFVVDDDIEIVGPAVFFVNAVAMSGLAIAFVDDHPLHVGAGGDAFGDDGFLVFVIVAAAAGDEEGFDWLISASWQEGTENNRQRERKS